VVGKRAKYVLVSVTALVLTQTVLFTMQLALHGRPVESSIVAWAVATAYCYEANRRYVWRIERQSRFITERLPFWLYSAFGLAVSVAVFQAALSFTQSLPRVQGALVNNGLSLSVSAAIWVGRYVLLEYLFGGRAAESLSECTLLTTAERLAGDVPSEWSPAQREGRRYSLDTAQRPQHGRRDRPRRIGRWP
jgi:putative flippase GtrA